MMDFKEKVVWITGASSGIGEHLAYAFAEQGASLVLSARNEDELERVRHNCQGAAAVRVFPFDLSDHEAIPKVVERVLAECGFISILVNNAGLSQRAAARDTTFEVDKKLMAVNFLGPVALTKAVLPTMVQQQFGQIVVISSILGKLGVPRRSAYAASKHALHGFFDSLRAELHPENIAVTVICPGYVHTNLPINALRGDGSPNNWAESNRDGLDPAVFAQKAVRAIRRREKEVYIAGWRELTAVYVNNLLPTLFFRIVRRVSWS